MQLNFSFKLKYIDCTEYDFLGIKQKSRKGKDGRWWYAVSFGANLSAQRNVIDEKSSKRRETALIVRSARDKRFKSQLDTTQYVSIDLTEESPRHQGSHAVY